MWTEKSSELLREALSTFEMKGCVHRRKVVEHLESAGYPRLASRFDRYSTWSRRKSEIRLILDSALNARVCVHCNERFARVYVCPDCENTPEGKAVNIRAYQEAKNATVKKRYGVDNVMFRKETKFHRKELFLERYGVDSPFKIPEVQKKAQRTMKERYGVENASHSDELLHKALSSAYRSKTCIIAGREFRYQGVEDRALRLLIDRFGVDRVLSQFDYEFQRIQLDQQKYSTYGADLYVRGKGYVEVKSVWTLLGDYRQGVTRGLKRNRTIQRSCNERGMSLTYLVLEGGKHMFLPKDWWSWSLSKLKRLLEIHLGFKFYL